MLLVFVEMLLYRSVRGMLGSLKTAVQAKPELLEAHRVTGGITKLQKTRMADVATYLQFIGSVIWTHA